MRVRPIVLTASLVAVACGGPAGPAVPKRAPLAQQWLDRAKQAYASGDLDDAKASSEKALAAAPRDEELRMMAARVELARLDYGDAAKLLEGVAGAEAAGLRGRARWYAGDLLAAADDLEAELADPAVKDPWARDVAKLARTSRGRHPFAIEGGIVAAVDMPPAGALVVPCELDGERVLAMIATGSAEVIVDAGSHKEPEWINLRFGDRVEVKDVPALPQDLGPLSRQLGGTVKVLLGVNFLRHAHVTFDRRGSQFVVRAEEPPAPPDASRVPLAYSKGGGMLMKLAVSRKDDGGALVWVDSSQAFGLALRDPMWKKAGVEPSALKPIAELPGASAAPLSTLRIGGYDFPGMPALSVPGLADSLPAFDLEPSGVMGASLLGLFRVTLSDGGRYAWLEADPSLFSSVPPASRDDVNKPAADSPAPSAAPAPAPSAAPAPAKKPSSLPSAPAKRGGKP